MTTSIVQQKAKDLLRAATELELVAVTDIVDRAHLVRLRGDDVVEAAAEEARLVQGLIDAGLAQLGEVPLVVPWYGGEARGVRVLATEKGLTALGETPAATVAPSWICVRGGGDS